MSFACLEEVRDCLLMPCPTGCGTEESTRSRRACSPSNVSPQTLSIMRYRRPFESTRQKNQFYLVSSSVWQAGEKPAAQKGDVKQNLLITSSGRVHHLDRPTPRSGGRNPSSASCRTKLSCNRRHLTSTELAV